MYRSDRVLKIMVGKALVIQSTKLKTGLRPGNDGYNVLPLGAGYVQGERVWAVLSHELLFETIDPGSAFDLSEQR